MPKEPIFTRDFRMVFTAHAFLALSFFLFIHLPRFLEDKGANPVEIGILVGVTAVAAIAIRPPVGRWLDSLGRRPVLIFGSLANFVSIVLYLTVGSLGPWIYIVRIIHGLAQGATFTALFTYTTDIVPASRRTEGLALFGVSGFAPMALGGLIGDLILEGSNFTPLFVGAAVLGFVAFLLILALPERRPARPPGATAARFLDAVTQRNLRPLWLVTFIFAIVITSYFTFLRTFIDEVEFGSVGAFFLAYASTAILLRAFGAWLPERVGPKRLLFPAFGALTAGFFVLAGATGAGAIAVAGVLTGAGHGYVFPILLSLSVTRASDEARGNATAFFTALFDIGILVGGPALGAIISLAGYGWMYTAAGLTTIAGVAVFAAWDRRYQPLGARSAI